MANGLYNVLFGVNPASDVLLATLGLDRRSVGRFRDVWVEPERIVVHTRNGGGNRKHWDEETEAGESCSCTGCIMTYRLPKHPQYLGDEDDSFDCTYANVYFSFPPDYAEELKQFVVEPDHVKPSEKWQQLLKEMEKKDGSS